MGLFAKRKPEGDVTITHDTFRELLVAYATAVAIFPDKRAEAEILMDKALKEAESHAR